MIYQWYKPTSRYIYDTRLHLWYIYGTGLYLYAGTRPKPVQIKRKDDGKSRGKVIAHTQHKWLMMALSTLHGH